MGLFGKKEPKPYRVIYDEGIEDIATNLPCDLLINDDIMYIDFCSGLRVTLPMQRIIKIEALNTCDFYTKYRNAGGSINAIDYFLVVTYTSKENDKKRLVLKSVTHRETMYFIELHHQYNKPSGHIEL